MTIHANEAAIGPDNARFYQAESSGPSAIPPNTSRVPDSLDRWASRRHFKFQIKPDTSVICGFLDKTPTLPSIQLCVEK